MAEEIPSNQPPREPQPTSTSINPNHPQQPPPPPPPEQNQPTNQPPPPPTLPYTTGEKPVLEDKLGIVGDIPPPPPQPSLTPTQSQPLNRKAKEDDSLNKEDDRIEKEDDTRETR